MSQREKLLDGLNLAEGLGLEIGALDKPMLRRSEGQVLYVDYTDAETLREKYRNDAYVNVDNIVAVDSIWGENTLQDSLGAGRKVDYIVASHVIEHVPDLITWLQELRSVLNPGGQVRLIIPDRCFTFDYLRAESRLSDVLNAYLYRARAPLVHAVLDFHLNAAKIDCSAAWEGRIDPRTIEKYNSFDEVMSAARDVLERHTYHDVHCWVFTPKSFALLLRELGSLGLIDFACERFYDTGKYTFEFLVSLRPSSNKEEIAESWRQMAASVNTHAFPSSPAREEELTAQARAYGETLETLQKSLAGVQAQLGKTAARLAVAEAQRQTAQARLVVLRQERDEARASLRAECAKSTQMQNSRSWKVTRPLRALTEWSRRAPRVPVRPPASPQ